MINTNKYTIKFEDYLTSPFSIEDFRSLVIEDKEFLREKIKSNNSNLKNYFLHQVHGNNGVILTEPANIKSFDIEGDYIITGLKNVEIGILTADCLPIIFYDNVNNIVAIAHAGWKGTVKNIAQATVQNMQSNFGTKIDNLEVFFGPSAKVCCYEVDLDFAQKIKPEYVNKTLIKKDDQKYLFDLVLYNKLLLSELNITKINLTYNICTICNTQFCSYRRQKEKSGLQRTTVMLK